MTEEEKKNEKEIDLKIFDINYEIDRGILAREDDLPQEIKDFRQRVLYVHSIVESEIDVAVMVRLFNTVDSNDKEEWSKKIEKIWKFRESMEPIVDQMIFAKKVRYARDNNLITADQAKFANKLNDIRNNLAHIKRNRPSEYLIKQNRYEALKIVSETVNIFKKTKEVVKDQTSG